jgi:hypothetical protein
MNKNIDIKRIKYCTNKTVVKISEYTCVKAALNGRVKLEGNRKKEQKL